MSKIHVLKVHDKEISAVIHYDMPSGSNSAGKTWKDCWISLGNAVTTLNEGTDPGEINAAEKTQVEAGDVVEFAVTLRIDGTPTLSELNALADMRISGHKADMARELKYYGMTEG